MGGPDGLSLVRFVRRRGLLSGSFLSLGLTSAGSSGFVGVARAPDGCGSLTRGLSGTNRAGGSTGAVGVAVATAGSLRGLRILVLSNQSPAILRPATSATGSHREWLIEPWARGLFITAVALRMGRVMRSWLTLIASRSGAVSRVDGAVTACLPDDSGGTEIDEAASASAATPPAAWPS